MGNQDLGQYMKEPRQETDEAVDGQQAKITITP